MNQFDRSRQERNKGKAVVLAGMIGAAIGAVIAGGGVLMFAGPGAIQAAPIVAVFACGAAFVSAIAGGAVAAGIAYVFE